MTNDRSTISPDPNEEAGWSMIDENGTLSGQSEMVDWMSVEYPATFEFFQKMLLQELDLFCSKQHDYGPQNIALGQKLDSEEERHFAILGVMIRTLDKVNRMMTLLKNGKKPQNESLKDTLQDIANYANIALCVYENVWGQ